MLRRTFLAGSLVSIAAAQSHPRPAGIRRGHVLAASPTGDLYLFGGLEPPDSSGIEPLWIRQDGQWRRATQRGPGNRSLPGGTFDTRRGVFVVYGGIAGHTGTRYADMWEWNGSEWREHVVMEPAPGPRDHHAMVYDSARSRIVSYGGSVGIERPGIWWVTTWEHDGAAWKEFTGRGPGPRAHHAMAYDPVRKMTVLFGGMNKEERHPPETWGWDGASWQKMADEGPGPRARHRMAFHESSGDVILYGGNAPQNGPGFQVAGDTWAWNGRSWREIKPSRTPGPRFMHAMAYDAAAKCVVLYGGVQGATADDAWAWDGRNWESW